MEEGRGDGRTDDTGARTTTATDETATGERRGGRRETQLLDRELLGDAHCTRDELAARSS